MHPSDTRQAPAPVPPARILAIVLGASASAAITVFLVAMSVQRMSGRAASTWLMGRAAGLTSYILMIILVLIGMALANPDRMRNRLVARFAALNRVTQLRIHLGLAVFMLAFTAGHAISLAIDKHAGVGWWGAFVPMASTYRPVPVTLGVLAAEAALVAAVTALLAGRALGRLWGPIHQFAGVCLVLTWLHAVLAGTDTKSLQWFYLITGLSVVLLAFRRYTALRPVQDIALTHGTATWIRDGHE